jgi:hypothetical protein
LGRFVQRKIARNFLPYMLIQIENVKDQNAILSPLSRSEKP